MQAIFRFNGYDEIVISTQGPGILVEHIEAHPATPEEKEEYAKPHVQGPQSWYIDPSGFYRRTATLINLSKSGARSMASALMQAAAEI